MSVPLDRLYHYIQTIAEEVYGDNILIYRFSPHGSKNINDLTSITKVDISVPPWWQYPEMICYDQEPLDYDFYQSTKSLLAADHEKKFGNELDFLKGTNLRIYSNNIYDKCLLLHSEQNSVNVEKYKNSHFIPVYYWSHAVIARDWFRYAEHVKIEPGDKQKQFLIYNRAWAGTREYRLKFIELLANSGLADVCQAAFNPMDPEHNKHYTDHVFKNINFRTGNIDNIFPTTTASNTSSADFDIDDYANTKFEVVLETLFDDYRIQLTEKILRPIACGQPFILASTVGSLAYLRKYGFKTFDTVFDETYDSEADPIKRLQLIINTMQSITAWTPEEQTANWKKINVITEHNKKHFFSDDFENYIVNELKTNLKTAVTELENTNTSKNFINFRKKYNSLPEIRSPALDKSRREERKLRKKDFITVLLKARRYYNRYLKTLD